MKSFLQGKRSIEMAALRKPVAPAAAGGTDNGDAGNVMPAGAAPHIDIVKQGDKIVRIIVTCTCGERTEIECLYPPGQ